MERDGFYGHAVTAGILQRDDGILVRQIAEATASDWASRHVPRHPRAVRFVVPHSCIKRSITNGDHPIFGDNDFFGIVNTRRAFRSLSENRKVEQKKEN